MVLRPGRPIASMESEHASSVLPRTGQEIERPIHLSCNV